MNDRYQAMGKEYKEKAIVLATFMTHQNFTIEASKSEHMPTVHTE